MSKGPSCPEGPEKCLRRSENGGEGCIVGQCAFNLLLLSLQRTSQADFGSHLFFVVVVVPPMYLSTHWTSIKSAASLVMNWKLLFHRPAAQSIKNLFEYCSNCLHQCALLLVLEETNCSVSIFVIQTYSSSLISRLKSHSQLSDYLLQSSSMSLDHLYYPSLSCSTFTDFWDKRHFAQCSR